MKVKERKEYMKPEDKIAMSNWPRTHQNCRALTRNNVARPGKTAQDRARRHP